MRNMRLAGLSENVAMQISGHRTRAMFDRYDIVGATELNEAAAKLEQRLAKSLGTILGTIADLDSSQKNEQNPNTTRNLLSWITFTEREGWLRGMDLNHRPLGYEPNELPDCSTPHSHSNAGLSARQTPASGFRSLRS